MKGSGGKSVERRKTGVMWRLGVNQKITKSKRNRSVMSYWGNFEGDTVE